MELEDSERLYGVRDTELNIATRVACHLAAGESNDLTKRWIAEHQRRDEERLRQDIAKHNSWKGFVPTRYPYTYAYDLLRNTIDIGEDNSRAAASQFMTEFCNKHNLPKEAACRQLADIYIKYERAIEDATAQAERERDAAIARVLTEEV